MNEPVRRQLRRCARCGRDHDEMQFALLTHPVVDGDGTTWTHWAPCPTNSEPILLRTADIPREVPPRGCLRFEFGDYAQITGCFVQVNGKDVADLSSITGAVRLDATPSYPGEWVVRFLGEGKDGLTGRTAT